MTYDELGNNFQRSFCAGRFNTQVYQHKYFSGEVVQYTNLKVNEKVSTVISLATVIYYSGKTIVINHDTFPATVQSITPLTATEYSKWKEAQHV